VNESYMLRSDGVSFRVCKGCGTIPIENPKNGLFVCPLCTGPIGFIGSGSQDLELVPPIRKTMIAPVTVEMPYAFKLLAQELETYMNVGMRIMTEKDLLTLDGLAKTDLPDIEVTGSDLSGLEGRVLPERALPEVMVPEYREEKEGPLEASPELLMKLGALPKEAPMVSEGLDIVVDGTGVQGSIQAATAAVAAAANASAGPVQGSIVQTLEGPVFQPTPTTVTVVPPARSIQVVPGSEPEAVTANEELGDDMVPPPQVQPPAYAQQPQAYAQQPPPYGYPPQQMAPPYGYPQPQMMAPPYAYPQQPFAPYPGVNMGQAPAVYANPALQQPAQIIAPGVPGAPPTISVPTDSGTMANFALPQGPKPKKSFTLKKGRGVSFAPGGGGEQVETQGGGANITVTVSKMN
jgi:hypothetical protein